MLRMDAKRYQCEVAIKLTEIPETVGKILADYVAGNETGSISAIYFAAPPTEMDYILRVRKELRKRGVTVYTAHEMISYLERNWGNCEQVTSPP